MTRDEILNMPAGREMDAYIAEKVTGISTCPWHGNIPADDTPYYSTDIASACRICRAALLAVMEGDK